MKQLFLFAVFCISGVAMSQQCCQNYNNYQSNYYNYNSYQPIQTVPIYPNPVYVPQYQTEFGPIFDGLIRVITTNQILKNQRRNIIVNCGNNNNKRKKRKRWCR